MIYLLNVLDLTHLAPTCEYFFNNGGIVKLPISQVCIKLPSISQSFNLVSFELFNKTRDPEVLVYPLTCPITQTLGGGLIGFKFKNNTPIFYGTKKI